MAEFFDNSRPQRGEEDMSGKHILLVDDERFILDTLARDLENEPFSLSLAPGGEHAVCKIEKHNFDLVVTDILMEDMDGFQVLKAAKKKNPRTLVIMLTGYADTLLVIDALRLGANDFLQKPCDSEELLFRIENCFARQNPADTIGDDETLLSVCAYCRKIQSKKNRRRANDVWYSMEEYFSMVQQMKISHGCCPECYTRQIAQIAGKNISPSL
jgi:DNA-binding response OmpR family regulator